MAETTGDNKEDFWKALSGIAAVLTASAALVAGLHQAGLIGGKKVENTVIGNATDRAESGVKTTQSAVADNKPAGSNSEAELEPDALDATEGDPVASGNVVDADRLLTNLKQHRVTNSVGDDRLKRWFGDSDRHYLRIAKTTLAMLGKRRLRDHGADIDQISAFYLHRLNLPIDHILPLEHQIDRKLLAAAVLDAYNEKNGTNVTRWGGAVEPM